MKNICKTGSLIMASGLMLLLFICAPAFGAENEKQTYNDLLNKYKETHQEIILELKKEKVKSAEIFKLFQEINRLNEFVSISIKNKKTEDQQKYQSKLEKLWASYYANYWASIVPALHSSESSEYGIESSQKKIESVLDDSITIYNGSLNCFDNQTYTASKDCERFRKSCVKYGSENGDMYYYELTKELELKKIDVSESEPRLLDPADNELKQIRIPLQDIILPKIQTRVIGV